MSLTYEEYGERDRPLLLFIHGGGVGSWMWDKQVPYFSDYHCIVPTLQGHGSRSEESTFSINENAQEIIKWIKQHKNGRKVTVVGFSIGAQITVEILCLAPDLLDAAVVNSALVMPMKFARTLISPSIHLTLPLSRNRAFSKAQAKILYMDGEYFEKYYADSIKIKTKTLIALLKENMSYSLPDSFSTSKTRILVTVGENERRIMKQSAERMQQWNPTCTCMIVPKIGHGFPFAQPDIFNQVVSAWLMGKPIHKL